MVVVAVADFAAGSTCAFVEEPSCVLAEGEVEVAGDASEIAVTGDDASEEAVEDSFVESEEGEDVADEGEVDAMVEVF